MAAPQIPNLLSMRGAHRSRGGGRGRGGPGFTSVNVNSGPAASSIDKDRLVRETDTDANVSRRSAVNCGYLEDPYASEFGGDDAPRRLPIINRGTYVRTVVIDRLIENFIDARPEQTVQIISLGAGTDTRFFRYLDRGHGDQIMYHEIDFPVISNNKLAYIRSSIKLSHPDSGFYALQGPQELYPESKKWGYYTDEKKKAGYMFHPMDLRQLPDEIHGIQTDVPTVIVSECCLCYLAKEEADKVISYFTKRIPTIGIILYEPTNPTDSFGRMMTANLASRRLAMPSIQAYDSLDAQMDRLKDLSFDMFQEGASIDWLWENWIADDEKVRLSRLQMFDEEEEWKMLASHYLVCWAAREAKKDDGAFEGWDDLEGEEERRIKETDEE